VNIFGTAYKLHVFKLTYVLLRLPVHFAQDLNFPLANNSLSKALGSAIGFIADPKAAIGNMKRI
jgi:hypothetical protein